MNRVRRAFLSGLTLLVLMPLLLTGCWNKYELTDWAFVQAVAIDQAENQRIQLTTFFYKPGGGAAEGPKIAIEGFNLRTKGGNMSEAISNISNSLGRIAQWSQMRIILISEEMAKNRQMKGIIDYFLRDHEPRETVRIAIVKGKASEYLKKSPYIESTIGQQLREMNETSREMTGNTEAVNLLQAAIQLKSESGIALLPYMALSGENNEQMTMNGLAIFKNYSMLEPNFSMYDTRLLLMLRNQYDRGLLAFLCEGDPENRKDTFEHVKVQSTTKVVPQGETVAVKIKLALHGSYGELRCTTVKQPQDEKEVEKAIRDLLEREFRKITSHMQSKRLDLMSIGDNLYRYHPALWREWKKNWGERLSRAKFEFQIDVKMTNTGLTKPEPYGE